MSEKVTESGAPVLLLNDGGTATYKSGSGTSTLAFHYVVGAGQVTSDLRVSGIILSSTSAIEDLAGNAANLSAAGVDTKLGINTPPGIAGRSERWQPHNHRYAGARIVRRLPSRRHLRVAEAPARSSSTIRKALPAPSPALRQATILISRTLSSTRARHSGIRQMEATPAARIVGNRRHTHCQYRAPRQVHGIEPS